MPTYRVVGQALVVFTIVAVGSILPGCRHEQPSYVLRYNVLPNAWDTDQSIDMRSQLIVLHDRLRGFAVPAASGSRQIEVRLYGEVDADRLEMVKRLLATKVQLEFRITADSRMRKDKPIIEQAILLPPTEKEVLLDGRRVAEWVAYAVEEFGPIDADNERGIVKRMTESTPEALVLTELDAVTVTGDFLATVSKGVDERGQPAIHFSFDTKGARLFERLTSHNGPDPATGAVRYLGIIVDKKLLAAPSIRGTITRSGLISGHAMSESEVNAIVTILGSGHLPYPLQLVEERAITE